MNNYEFNKHYYIATHKEYIVLKDDEFITGGDGNQIVIEKGGTVTEWEYNDLDFSTSVLEHLKRWKTKTNSKKGHWPFYGKRYF